MEEELPVHNSQTDNKESLESIVKVTGMYRDWFLDYASYVILERAVPDLMDGLNFTLSYDPQVEGTSGTGSDGQVGYGVNYSGVEGLSLSYATTDVNDHSSNGAGDNSVIKASYAYGPVTVGFSEMEHDENNTSGAGDITMTSYNISYTVSDEISLSYGTEESNKGSATTDLEVSGISASYTSGGMTLSLTMQELENGNWGTGSEEDMDYWALGASFAF